MTKWHFILSLTEMIVGLSFGVLSLFIFRTLRTKLPSEISFFSLATVKTTTPALGALVISAVLVIYPLSAISRQPSSFPVNGSVTLNGRTPDVVNIGVLPDNQYKIAHGGQAIIDVKHVGNSYVGIAAAYVDNEWVMKSIPVILEESGEGHFSVDLKFRSQE